MTLSTIYSKVLCPHCKAVFPITEEEQYDCTVFVCPGCKKFNWGSTGTNEAGVLIGERYVDCQDCGSTMDSADYKYKRDQLNDFRCKDNNCEGGIWV